MANDLRDPTVHGIKGFMNAFSGLVVAAFAHLNRKLVLSTVQKAYERGSYRLTELSVPSALDEIVLKCLEKRPADRPAGAGFLSEQLGGIETEAPWTHTNMARWWQLHRPRAEGA